MIDQDAYAQQCADTRKLRETVTRLAAERRTLLEELAAARQRANQETAAAAAARAEVGRLRELSKLQDDLLACYRLGRRPSGKLFGRLGVNDAPDRELYIIFIRPRAELFPDEGCTRRALHVNHHAGGLS